MGTTTHDHWSAWISPHTITDQHGYLQTQSLISMDVVTHNQWFWTVDIYCIWIYLYNNESSWINLLYVRRKRILDAIWSNNNITKWIWSTNTIFCRSCHNLDIVMTSNDTHSPEHWIDKLPTDELTEKSYKFWKALNTLSYSLNNYLMKNK